MLYATNSISHIIGFYNNSITSLPSRSVVTNIEGCNFQIQAICLKLFNQIIHNNIVNSTITGRVDITRTANHLFGTP
jgi:hypothetical protein